MDVDGGGDCTRSELKNAHLKGPRRFKADLDDMKAECLSGFGHYGYLVKRLRAGDDDGSVEVTITGPQAQQLSLSLLVSDTSDYPTHHTFFSYSPDSDIPPHALGVVEDLASGPSRSIRASLLHVLRALGGHLEIESQVEDDGSDDGYEALDDLDMVLVGQPIAGGVSRAQPQKLQNDFIEVVATGYRPGIIQFGNDDFAISVSIPVVTLAEIINPRALRAWDRRLLSRSQHLTLLISGFRGVYPPIGSDGKYNTLAQQFGTALTFKVGLTDRYKPGVEYAKDATRTFGLIAQEAEDVLRIQSEEAASLEINECELEQDEEHTPESQLPVELEDDFEDEGRLDRFSLSSSLESLLEQVFLKVLQLRKKFSVGWAGAEVLYSEIERHQSTAEFVFETSKDKILAADEEERKLGFTNSLPHDPLTGLEAHENINIPLATFCYLMRRLMLCTRYCLVCHDKLQNDFQALKPYVCDSKLCAYQYYTLNRGPSLEYEIIHNPQTVDLLVSLAHSAAAEQVLEDPLPVGLGLRVPLPDMRKIPQTPQYPYHASPAPTLFPARQVTVADDGLCDFDDLTLPMMRASIVQMIDILPGIDDMKKNLERKVRAEKAKPKLKVLYPDVVPAAWSILRWCVASCTAYLEEITSSDESIRHIDPGWRQFRFSVGAPDAEAKFQAAISEAQQQSTNAQQFPTLYAFHGSPLKNWHSIIRHGLWYKTITHGRAHGNGVYLAKEGNISMSGYAVAGKSTWHRSRICATNCVALAEIVNLPNNFTCSQPYFVVQHTHWIMCRYLLVKGVASASNDGNTGAEVPNAVIKTMSSTPLVKLDKLQPVTLNGKRVEIPDPSHEIDMLLLARRDEYMEEDNDFEDLAIFESPPPPPTYGGITSSDDEDMIYLDDHDDYPNPLPQASSPTVQKTMGKGKKESTHDWMHDGIWVSEHVRHLMPPPVEAMPSATMAVQRELKALLREQKDAKSLKDLGWYLPPDLIEDNLFRWIVEMHSFDETLPIAKDLNNRKINSVIFEIRFPPDFPLSPPFFRIVTPRFLPFIQGGGGHVTGGGSICMDLLTADGWLPSYSISAVLMQIKLAISNLEPRPARLAINYNVPYGVGEALDGYKRAAATHGWKVPFGIEKLVR